VTIRYELDADGRLTANGRQNARLDAIALIEAQIDRRHHELANLHTATTRGDLTVLSAALVDIASEALVTAVANPKAVLAALRLKNI
jgi:hypothetical protein